jgi:hypothetical protein
MRHALAILLLTLPACGGGNGKTADAATPPIDAPPGVDAAPQIDGAPTPSCTCLALGVDYMAGVGAAARVDLPSMTVHKDVLPGAVQSDPVVRYLGGTIYIVNRFAGENVTIVDPSTWTVKTQFSTGAGSNPQDIAIKGATAYVVTLGMPLVEVWDLSTTPPTQGTPIMLPTIGADTDGNPDAASIVIDGNLAYVSLEHLVSFAPAAKGQVAVIDTTTNTVVTSLFLQNENPVNFMRPRVSKGDLLVAEAPDFTAMTGCLEKITLGAMPAAAGCIVSSMSLGGYVAGAAPSTDGHVYLAAQTNPTTSKLVAISDQGMVDDVPYSTSGESPTDVATCDAAHLLLANDAATGGLRVYDTMTHMEVTTTALDIGLPAGFANDIVCF